MLQCSGYTCGTGFSADASKQSTACPSGTCTDGFCCQPKVCTHIPMQCMIAVGDVKIAAHCLACVSASMPCITRDAN
jgi:hypothetical protein